MSLFLDGAGWGLVPHQQRPNMLLPIPRRHTTLSTLIFLLDPPSKSEFLSFYPLRMRRSGFTTTAKKVLDLKRTSLYL
jgi:hypothetical protein